MSGRRWPTCSEGAVGSTPTYAPMRFSVRSQSSVCRPLWCVSIVSCQSGPHALTPQHPSQSHALQARLAYSAVPPTLFCPPAPAMLHCVRPHPTLLQPIFSPVVHHAPACAVSVYNAGIHIAGSVTNISAWTSLSVCHESRAQRLVNIEKGRCQGP
jgi:hypothetical protein